VAQDNVTTTLSLTSRRSSIAAGVAVLVVAAVLAVVAVLWVAKRSSDNAWVFLAIPVAVIAVFVLVELAVRIMRLRVTVTPTTITSYNRAASRATPSIFGGRTVHSVRTDQVGAIVVREYSQIGSHRIVPSVVCHDGSEFTLDALTAESERKAVRQSEELELLRDLTGVRVDGLGPVAGVTGQSGILPPPLRVAPATAGPVAAPVDLDYPPPTGPPPYYDPSRWQDVPVPASPAPPESNAPGWRYDPVTLGRYRYFDGTRWTEWVYNGMAVSAAHIA
jgi:hypothetical protein